MPTWTVARVKEELPDVQVMHHGKVVTMQVRGRKLGFAFVSTFMDTSVSLEYAWSTVARSLNTGRPLRQL